MIKKFLRGLNKGTAFFIAAMLGLGTVVLAQTYTGYNSTTGLNSTYGADVTIGPLPVLTGCATISASVGGPTAGRFQTSGTSCNLVITFPGAAPNGWACFATNITSRTSTNVVVQSATTTTSCTFAGTTVASDNIIWNAIGY